MYPRHFVTSFCLSLALLSGCAASAETLNSASTGDPEHASCTIDPATFKHLPQQVLVGTDIQELSHFSATSTLTDKRYQAEMGGATLTVSIERYGSSLRLHRTYQEAGMTADRRTYATVCRQGSLLTGKTLKGKLVREGLLLLETKSGVEGIPNNLWVLYRPAISTEDHRKGTPQ